MHEKHPSYLQRPPWWPCPFVKCKCHQPGFRYQVHYLQHLEQCHRKWYGRAKAHPEILAELQNPRQFRDEGDKPVPWIDALNDRLCALERRAERVTQAVRPAIEEGGDGGGGDDGDDGSDDGGDDDGSGGGGSSRPPVTLHQGQSAGGSTVPAVVPPFTFEDYLESLYDPDSAREGVPAVGFYQNYHTPGAGYEGVLPFGIGPPFGADPSYDAPNLHRQDVSVLGGYHQSLYGTDLARGAMGPPPVPARLQSHRIPLIAPNVTPNGSDAGDGGGDDSTPGQQP